MSYQLSCWWPSVRSSVEIRASSVYMGHLAIGLAARRVSTSLPLWFLLTASASPDLVNAFGGFTPWSGWFIHHSHTLAGIGFLAVAIAMFAWLISRSIAGAALAAGLVVSHLLADWIATSVRAWAGGPSISLGLHLYQHPITDFFVELAVILVGLYFYRQSFGLKRLQNIWPSIAMLVVLVGFQAIWDGMLLTS